MSVCMSARISPKPHARFYQISYACCLWPWLGPPPKSQGEAAILGIFFRIDNALYNSAFETHTKTAEPIEMPFGMISGFNPRNSLLPGGKRKRQCWGKTCLTSLTPLSIANWIGPYSGVHTIVTDAWLQASHESVIGSEGDCTPWAKSDIYDCLVVPLPSNFADQFSKLCHLQSRHHIVIKQSLNYTIPLPCCYTTLWNVWHLSDWQ